MAATCVMHRHKLTAAPVCGVFLSCHRGQMWQSGYVVVPTSSGCCISVTLQVDPKVRGWGCGILLFNKVFCVWFALSLGRIAGQAQPAAWTVLSTEAWYGEQLCNLYFQRRHTCPCCYGCVSVCTTTCCLHFMTPASPVSYPSLLSTLPGAGLDPHPCDQLVP